MVLKPPDTKTATTTDTTLIILFQITTPSNHTTTTGDSCPQRYSTGADPYSQVTKSNKLLL